ncbi:large conductance mechanosensitive channel protein MscL [Agrococcus jejuensis]|uniref:large conductance mechanosensitive channel protein MscL n=1 Tax=Agrococcus jejuensis TaxID=399736 RepID=UPI0011A430EE|nr:large conductance mechanosensitive channel protein MscL [Agrococcus jejuensis]
MQGFKEFILRGNVIELATAVIIGTAFTAIVTALVEGIFTPIIANLFDTSDIAEATWNVTDTLKFGTGAVIAAVINFLLIAAVVYFALILPMAKFKERQAKRRGTTEEAAKETDVDVLQDIRELLRQQAQATPPATTQQ